MLGPFHSRMAIDLPSLDHDRSKYKKTTVLWDYENKPMPRDCPYSVKETLQFLTELPMFQGCEQFETITALQSFEPNKKIMDQLNEAGVVVFGVKNKEKDAADNQLMARAREVVENNNVYHNLVFITGDGGFVPFIQDLKRDKRVSVTVIYPPNCSDQLKRAGHYSMPFTELFEESPEITTNSAPPVFKGGKWQGLGCSPHSQKMLINQIITQDPSSFNYHVYIKKFEEKIISSPSILEEEECVIPLCFNEIDFNKNKFIIDFLELDENSIIEHIRSLIPQSSVLHVKQLENGFKRVQIDLDFQSMFSIFKKFSELFEAANNFDEVKFKCEDENVNKLLKLLIVSVQFECFDDICMITSMFKTNHDDELFNVSTAKALFDCYKNSLIFDFDNVVKKQGFIHIDDILKTLNIQEPFARKIVESHIKDILEGKVNDVKAMRSANNEKDHFCHSKSILHQYFVYACICTWFSFMKEKPQGYKDGIEILDFGKRMRQAFPDIEYPEIRISLIPFNSFPFSLSKANKVCESKVFNKKCLHLFLLFIQKKCGLNIDDYRGEIVTMLNIKGCLDRLKDFCSEYGHFFLYEEDNIGANFEGPCMRDSGYARSLSSQSASSSRHSSGGKESRTSRHSSGQNTRSSRHPSSQDGECSRLRNYGTQSASGSRPQSCQDGDKLGPLGSLAFGSTSPPNRNTLEDSRSRSSSGSIHLDNHLKCYKTWYPHQFDLHGKEFFDNNFGQNEMTAENGKEFTGFVPSDVDQLVGQITEYLKSQ